MAGPRRVPMVNRPVITERFEKIAVDIVGPLPKEKGSAEYLLTIMCMASRWPEAIPLKRITAKPVADAMLPIFSRIELPLVILSDQGSQFSSKLAKEVCKLLQIDQVCTTAYHLKTNGMIERFHGTLEGILTKAVHKGIDWVDHLRFALFAVRQMPCRTTGYSPFELIYGRNVCTPLDILYEGWKDEHKKGSDASAWVKLLAEMLEVMWDYVVAKGLKETEIRKIAYEKGKVDRELTVVELVMCKIPGMSKKLHYAWEGPFRVIAVLGPVNYRVKEVYGKERVKVVHINNAKVYVE